MIKVFVILFFITLSIFGVAQPITTLQGFANSYVGKEIKVFVIEDYLSQVRTQIASSVVKADSSFELSFYNDQTRKLRVEVDENYLHIYAQPKASYNLFIGESSPYVDQKANRVEVEFYFYDLDSTDINYKILMFEDVQFNFLEANYNPRSVKSTNFVAKLDSFKVKMAKTYQGDTSQFFKIYIKFSIASLDDLAFVGQRNEYEKFDFYIKPETVWYQNDRYMSYILHYYKMYERQLPTEVNEKFYDAVIQSSPSLAMNALGGDYALKNIRLREVIMLKMLSEVFYTDDYPKTNILTMLDSVANHALFSENKVISSNLKYRLLDLVPGTKMPDFNLIVNGQKKFHSDYNGKHVYIQFISKAMKKSIEDMPLYYNLQQKYSKNTHFLTVLVADKDDALLKDPTPFIKKHNIAWDFSVISKENEILKKLNVTTFPHYILMDAEGVVVAAPALSPRPNNEYETIELVLVQINRRINAMQEELEEK